MRIKAILTDIEGTTSAISFVKKTLFPYAAAALPDFVRQHEKDKELRPLISEAAAIAGLDAQDLEKIIAQCLTWIDTDQKITPLKTIQGLIWESGYRSGAFKAHLYPDAHEALKAWHKAGVPLYVYSSGSIKAQQLFFEYSVFGDIRRLFTAYFDTTTGPKKETASYRKIALEIGCPVEAILFLSDLAAELDAAKKAGLQTCWLVRDAEASEKDPQALPHPRAHDFTEISLSA